MSGLNCIFDCFVVPSSTLVESWAEDRGQPMTFSTCVLFTAYKKRQHDLWLDVCLNKGLQSSRWS